MSVLHRPGSPPQPLFFRNVPAKQGMLTLHLPSATTTCLAAELLSALAGGKAAAKSSGSASKKSSISRQSSISELVSRVAAGISLVDPSSWRVLRVENVWCTVCDVSVPQMPLRTHLPMAEMQVRKRGRENGKGQRTPFVSSISCQQPLLFNNRARTACLGWLSASSQRGQCFFVAREPILEDIWLCVEHVGRTWPVQ